MRILIDENLPRQLKPMLAGHRVLTVQDRGWTGLKNEELIKKAESSFEVLLTADKSLRPQQNLGRLHLIIVVFPSNRLKTVETLAVYLEEAMALANPGSIIDLQPSKPGLAMKNPGESKHHQP